MPCYWFLLFRMLMNYARLEFCLRLGNVGNWINLSPAPKCSFGVFCHFLTTVSARFFARYRLFVPFPSVSVLDPRISLWFCFPYFHLLFARVWYCPTEMSPLILIWLSVAIRDARLIQGFPSKTVDLGFGFVEKSKLSKSENTLYIGVEEVLCLFFLWLWARCMWTLFLTILSQSTLVWFFTLRISSIGLFFLVCISVAISQILIKSFSPCCSFDIGHPHEHDWQSIPSPLRI